MRRGTGQRPARSLARRSRHAATGVGRAASAIRASSVRLERSEQAAEAAAEVVERHADLTDGAVGQRQAAVTATSLTASPGSSA